MLFRKKGTGYQMSRCRMVSISSGQGIDESDCAMSGIVSPSVSDGDYLTRPGLKRIAVLFGKLRKYCLKNLADVRMVVVHQHNLVT